MGNKNCRISPETDDNIKIIVMKYFEEHHIPIFETYLNDQKHLGLLNHMISTGYYFSPNPNINDIIYIYYSTMYRYTQRQLQGYVYNKFLDPTYTKKLINHDLTKITELLTKCKCPKIQLYIIGLWALLNLQYNFYCMPCIDMNNINQQLLIMIEKTINGGCSEYQHTLLKWKTQLSHMNDSIIMEDFTI